MEHKKSTYLILLFIGCFSMACKKELNVFPTTSEVDGNVIVDTKSASTVLNGVYYRLADAGNDYNGVPSILWVDANEAIPSELCGTIDEPGGSILSQYTFDYTAAEVKAVWDYGYKIVNAANGFLENVAPVTTIPSATKTEMIAEAKFLRAFGNAELLLYYGQYYDVNSKYGIILRTEFVNANNIVQPRTGVAAAYTSILADLDVAIAGLPAMNTRINYANVSAAKLLKARVLINRAAAGDYAQVISLTDDVINSGPFTLENNVMDIFLTKGFNSKEVILSVQPYPKETYKYFQYQYYNIYIASDSLVSLLNNDPRSQWVFQSAYSGSLNELTKYYTGDPTNTVQSPLSENSYAFRLTEAYLLEAEALTLSNGNLTTAKSLLKTVMGHAGITDFSVVNNTTNASDLQLLIVKEEMKNFVAENGADYFAFRRLPFSTIQKIKPEITSKNSLIMPIPYSEITVNNQMIQNPGY